ncbi:cobalamin-dependent protein [Uliginosibacterium sp. 31-16]|uniref:B12-binding domain-containing radical SAM protein n=1 Tax=Uliginosibacterium sp. 31-16 TaxID=3068315 RepID=UPI0027400FDF|nr:radical SAM protein [Uliginosibacterium sp. 31-16]MDP5240111.1 cobalamin-dependent protein [Uliginosibacterium sp. 31-16]
MRILLIYSNQSREMEPAAPVGLSYVASATQAAGHEVKLLDLAFSLDLTGDLAAAIQAFKPEVVGLSIRNIDNVVSQRFVSPQDALREQVAVIRQHARKPDGTPVPLVLGGPAISILAERALSLFGADFANVGEGEVAFPALINAIERGTPLSEVPGLCYWQDGVAQRNPTVLLPGFDHSGMQRFVNWKNYQKSGGTWPVQSKRGCGMKCTYCAYPLVEGSKLRLRPPGEVVDEIEQVLRDVKPRTFEFVDSTFNTPASHAIEICEEIIRRKIKASFTVMGLNPRDVPPELFPTMKRAGFNSMLISPEAGCDTMLSNFRKGFTMEHVNTCVDRARASGMKSFWFFMLGGLGETMETAEETIRFAEERLTGRQFLSVFFTGIRLLPDTELARQAIAEGYISADTDLSSGVFYHSPLVSEQALIDRVTLAFSRNPCIVHAADGAISDRQRMFYAWLDKLGVASPYWRFLPDVLSFPPLHYLRNKYPSGMAAGTP